jgi:hypothetical protein
MGRITGTLYGARGSMDCLSPLLLFQEARGEVRVRDRKEQAHLMTVFVGPDDTSSAFIDIHVKANHVLDEVKVVSHGGLSVSRLEASVTKSLADKGVLVE